MAHHMTGKYTIHDLRPFSQRVAKPFAFNSTPEGLFDYPSATYAAEALVKQGFRPRADFAVIQWVADVSGVSVLPRSVPSIHNAALVLWEQLKKRTFVVELWATGEGNDQCLFGWLIVGDFAPARDTRIALKREDATEFDALPTAEQMHDWYKRLGAPAHVQLVTCELPG